MRLCAALQTVLRRRGGVGGGGPALHLKPECVGIISPLNADWQREELRHMNRNRSVHGGALVKKASVSAAVISVGYKKQMIMCRC